eukprot:CAMPEP_0115880264 /NCGR_PEP_ID=MMETSP0287-20121206/27776_1 /TAXON_ID=412157 /ORGANISM="Chrysochromulina rotalis, Strain UIO044" /LENGTH=60 /DNA_ID=CAMNT_0003336059 /DNA_START=372 /DNA_END=550 /DNA_ORIENTATION=-
MVHPVAAGRAWRLEGGHKAHQQHEQPAMQHHEVAHATQSQRPMHAQVTTRGECGAVNDVR